MVHLFQASHYLVRGVGGVVIPGQEVNNLALSIAHCQWPLTKRRHLHFLFTWWCLQLHMPTESLHQSCAMPAMNRDFFRSLY